MFGEFDEIHLLNLSTLLKTHSQIYMLFKALKDDPQFRLQVEVFANWISKVRNTNDFAHYNFINNPKSEKGIKKAKMDEEGATSTYAAMILLTISQDES